MNTTTTTTTTQRLAESLHYAEHAYDELCDHLYGLYHRGLLPPQTLDYQLDNGVSLRELLGLEVTIGVAELTQ